MCLADGLRVAPVDGHSNAIHDAGLREDERTARYAGHAGAVDREAAQPGEGRVIGKSRAFATGANQQQVELVDVADRRAAWNDGAMRSS